MQETRDETMWPERGSPEVGGQTGNDHTLEPILAELPEAKPFDEHNWPMTCSTECHFLHMVQFPVNRELMLTGLC